MIKITPIPSLLPDAPTMFLIPGGAGLSSLTIRSLNLLKRSFNLLYVDLPGTNGLAYDKDRSFEELTAEIVAETQQVKGNAYILGHSFGGFFAAGAALQAPNVAGLVCIATPFTQWSLNAAHEGYRLSKSPELTTAEAKWADTPSDATFGEWLSEYGNLYFSESKRAEGKRLVKQDPCSYRLFQSLEKNAGRMAGFLPMLKNWSGKKLSIVGELDGLLPSKILKTDALAGGFDFRVVSNANHFVMLDPPESVAGLIEEAFATEPRRST